MKFKEYAQLSMRTLKDDEPGLQKLHLVLGMGGEFLSEVLELILEKNNPKELLEEVGDFMFYYACYCFVNDIEIPEELFIPYPLKTIKKLPGEELLYNLGKIQELEKKSYFYGKDVANKQDIISEALIRIITLFNFMITKKELKFKEVFIHNINKLRARFPEKFDEQAAIDQADKS